jgi:hypothetical protein
MNTKNIKFYKYNISIEGNEKLNKLINRIESDNIEPVKINNEVIKIESFKIKKFSDRFHGINIESGDLTHYSDVVIDTKDNLKIKENPRKKTQIELDNQFLLLIDTTNKNIYLSKANKRQFIEKQLSQKTNANVLVKEILDKKSFENSLKTISEVNFLFSDMDLFNQSKLNLALREDKYNYGSDSVRVIFNYRHRNFTGKIKQKILELMGGGDCQKLKIVGRDESNLETVFKSDSILSCIEIKSDLKEKTRQVDYITVLNELIIQIKNNE